MENDMINQPKIAKYIDQLHNSRDSKSTIHFQSITNDFCYQEADVSFSCTHSVTARCPFISISCSLLQSLNCVEIIETLASKLKRHRGLYNVLAITTAKVPIVKFRHRRTQLEGDISLYNTLVSSIYISRSCN